MFKKIGISLIICLLMFSFSITSTHANNNEYFIEFKGGEAGYLFFEIFSEKEGIVRFALDKESDPHELVGMPSILCPSQLEQYRENQYEIWNYDGIDYEIGGPIYYVKKTNPWGMVFAVESMGSGSGDVLTLSGRAFFGPVATNNLPFDEAVKEGAVAHFSIKYNINDFLLMGCPGASNNPVYHSGGSGTGEDDGITPETTPTSNQSGSETQPYENNLTTESQHGGNNQSQGNNDSDENPNEKEQQKVQVIIQTAKEFITTPTFMVIGGITLLAIIIVVILIKKQKRNR